MLGDINFKLAAAVVAPGDVLACRARDNARLHRLRRAVAKTSPVAEPENSVQSPRISGPLGSVAAVLIAGGQFVGVGITPAVGSGTVPSETL